MYSLQAVAGGAGGANFPGLIVIFMVVTGYVAVVIMLFQLRKGNRQLKQIRNELSRAGSKAESSVESKSDSPPPLVGLPPE